MAQTTVKLQQNIGFEGTLVTDNFASIRGALVPYYNKTGALLPFGRAVQITDGTASDVKPLDDEDATIVGITLYNDFQQGFPLTDPDSQGYDNESLVSVLIKGAADVCVWSENATTRNGEVWVRYATTDPVNKPLGRFRQGVFTGTITGITRTLQVATATTSAAHDFSVGDQVTITGATETEYNGTFEITSVPTATTFTYVVTGTPATPATGTITLDTADFVLWTDARFVVNTSKSGLTVLNIGGY